MPAPGTAQPAPGWGRATSCVGLVGWAPTGCVWCGLMGGCASAGQLQRGLCAYCWGSGLVVTKRNGTKRRNRTLVALTGSMATAWPAARATEICFPCVLGAPTPRPQVCPVCLLAGCSCPIYAPLPCWTCMPNPPTHPPTGLATTRKPSAGTLMPGARPLLHARPSPPGTFRCCHSVSCWWLAPLEEVGRGSNVHMPPGGPATLVSACRRLHTPCWLHLTPYV